MIEEIQTEYVELFLKGEIEQAFKIANGKFKLIDIWSSNSSFFPLLPHYLTYELTKQNKKYWKEALSGSLQLCSHFGFDEINGNTRKNKMSILHAYLLGLQTRMAKDHNLQETDILNDIRFIYKLGWKPLVINEKIIEKNKELTSWDETSINELAYAFVLNLPEDVIKPLLKIFDLKSPVQYNGYNLMQFALSTYRVLMIKKIEKLGFSINEPGTLIPESGYEILSKPDAFLKRLNYKNRKTDDYLIKVNDPLVWEQKIKDLIQSSKIKSLTLKR